METLPDDIVLYSILPWLPPKTLLRFMCVCKSWDSFIRHPSFLHLRKKLANNPAHIFLSLSRDPQSLQPLVYGVPHPNNNNIVTTPPRASFLFALPDLNFSKTRVKCVNGLLCFHPTIKPRFHTWYSSYVDAFTLIANPTTRQVLALPLDHSLDKKWFMVWTHFGYDPVRDRFKVLRWIKYEGGSHEFKVFTLDVDVSWRVVSPERSSALMHHHLRSLCNQRGLCVNGAIYWRHSTDLVIFDLGTEKFRVMPAPSGYYYLRRKRPWWHPDLAEIDGCLCLVGYSCRDLKLWILRDYCQAQVWEQKSIVIPSSHGEDFFPLCRVANGEILLLPHFPSTRLRAIFYDMDTMSSRSAVIMEMPFTRAQTLGQDILFCQESFRLLK